MTALLIPVNTMELARILLMDTTAAVQQVLLENNVRKVSLLKEKSVNQRTPRIREFKIEHLLKAYLHSGFFKSISLVGNAN